MWKKKMKNMKNKLNCALKKWFTIKNIVTIILISLVSLIIRIGFKCFEVNFGCFVSDPLFYFYSLTSISMSSYLRKLIELFEIPEINFSHIKDFFKRINLVPKINFSQIKDFFFSPLSEKIKKLKDLINYFYSFFFNLKLTAIGDDFYNKKGYKCIEQKKPVVLSMEGSNNEGRTNGPSWPGGKEILSSTPPSESGNFQRGESSNQPEVIGQGKFTIHQGKYTVLGFSNQIPTLVLDPNTQEFIGEGFQPYASNIAEAMLHYKKENPQSINMPVGCLDENTAIFLKKITKDLYKNPKRIPNSSVIRQALINLK